jgi:hypothetical protein
MVAVALSTLGAGWKWLTGWQQHERLVAQGLAVPVRKSRERAPKAPPAVIPVPVMPAMAEAVVE